MECHECGNPIPRPIDQFGDIRKPVCISCWLNGAGQAQESVISQLEDQLADVENDMEDVQGEIDDLEIQMHRLERESREIEEKIERAKRGEPIDPPAKRIDDVAMVLPLIEIARLQREWGG